MERYENHYRKGGNLNFLLCNMKFFGSKLLENELDEKLFKEIPFNSKTLIKGELYNYSYVCIPIIEEKSKLSKEKKEYIKSRTQCDPLFLETIFNFLSPLNILKTNFFIEEISKISHESLDIFYSDGSFKKATSESSYAVIQLNEESEDGELDYFSKRKMSYKYFSDSIQNGSNNIGELTGIKVAAENFGKKQIQIIISDSEYSLKCFREWFYIWRKNNFKAYSGKEIKNKKLIKETFNLLNKNEKIVLYKWTKGHAKNSFNELCDELAKKKLGISK